MRHNEFHCGWVEDTTDEEREDLLAALAYMLGYDIIFIDADDDDDDDPGLDEMVQS